MPQLYNITSDDILEMFTWLCWEFIDISNSEGIWKISQNFVKIQRKRKGCPDLWNTVYTALVSIYCICSGMDVCHYLLFGSSAHLMMVMMQLMKIIHSLSCSSLVNMAASVTHYTPLYGYFTGYPYVVIFPGTMYTFSRSTTAQISFFILFLCFLICLIRTIASDIPFPGVKHCCILATFFVLIFLSYITCIALCFQLS